eukprot:412671-Hanusia_phi.AAC.1
MAATCSPLLPPSLLANQGQIIRGPSGGARPGGSRFVAPARPGDPSGTVAAAAAWRLSAGAPHGRGPGRAAGRAALPGGNPGYRRQLSDRAAARASLAAVFDAIGKGPG